MKIIRTAIVILSVIFAFSTHPIVAQITAGQPRLDCGDSPQAIIPKMTFSVSHAGKQGLVSVMSYAVITEVYYACGYGLDCRYFQRRRLLSLPVSFDEASQTVTLDTAFLGMKAVTDNEVLRSQPICYEKLRSVTVLFNPKRIDRSRLLSSGFYDDYLYYKVQGEHYMVKGADSRMIRLSTEDLAKPPRLQSINLNDMPNISGTVVWEGRGVQVAPYVIVNIEDIFDHSLSAEETSCLAALSREKKSALVYGKFGFNGPTNNFYATDLSDETLEACNLGPMARKIDVSSIKAKIRSVGIPN